MNIKKTLGTCALLLGMTVSQANANWADWGSDYNDCYGQEDSPKILQASLGYTFGQEAFVRRNYGTIGLLYTPTPWCGEFQPFVDLRGHYFSNSRWAANAGVGLRWLDSCSCTAWGANLYYDYRRSHCKNNFNQIGAGLEWLSYTWEFRVNGYFPVGTTDKSCCRSFDTSSSSSSSSSSCCFDSSSSSSCSRACCDSSSSSSSSSSCFSSSSSSSSSGLDYCYGSVFNQRALRGFDAEVGRNFGFDCYNAFNFYVGIGPYYYNQRGFHDNNLWGGRFRANVSWSDYLTLETRVCYDRVNKTVAQGIVRLTIPFDWFSGCCDDPCQTCVPSILSRPVFRKEIIALERGCGFEFDSSSSSF